MSGGRTRTSSRVDLSEGRGLELLQEGECQHTEVPASYLYVLGAGLRFHSESYVYGQNSYQIVNVILNLCSLFVGRLGF